jgi:rod shape determining protein RodA
LPVVGAPLPLISYGGTSLLTVLIGVGLVLSINVHEKKI